MHRIEQALKRRLFGLVAPILRSGGGLAHGGAGSRVLIVRQDNRIGNQIFLLPLAQILRERVPAIFLGLLTGGRYPELLSEAGIFDAVHCYDQLGFLRAPWRFPAFLSELRRTRYDAALDAKRDFSFNNSMLAFLSGARAKIGFHHPETAGCFDREVPLPPDPLYEPEALAQLYSFFGPVENVPPPRLTLPEDRAAQALEELQTLGVPAGKQLVGIHPGGRGGKQWPLENMLGLCERLNSRGDLFKIIFLGPDEKKLKQVFEDGKNQRVVVPADTGALAGFVQCCKLVVCNDTGILHLAAALGLPTVSIFLTSSPRRYAPRGAAHAVMDGTGRREVPVEAVAEEVFRRLP